VIKYLVLVAVIVLVIWLATANSRAAARAQAKADGKANRPPEDMVRCARCGMFLPKAESVQARGVHFCSREHERLH